MNEQDDRIGNLIAEVARSHGVAISRDDPIVAVELLNQIVLRRNLEQTVVPALGYLSRRRRMGLGSSEQPSSRIGG